MVAKLYLKLGKQKDKTSVYWPSKQLSMIVSKECFKEQYTTYTTNHDIYETIRNQ